MDVESNHQLADFPLASGPATGRKGDKKVTSLILPLFRPRPVPLTRPNSDDQLTTMLLGTVAERRARGVRLMGRLGLLGSAPFFVGGR